MPKPKNGFYSTSAGSNRPKNKSQKQKCWRLHKTCHQLPRGGGINSLLSTPKKNRTAAETLGRKYAFLNFILHAAPLSITPMLSKNNLQKKNDKGCALNEAQLISGEEDTEYNNVKH